MKTIIGLLLLILGVFVMAWFPFVYLLYGGIMQAVENWGVDNALVVTGILKAVLFELGMIPGWILLALGGACLTS